MLTWIVKPVVSPYGPVNTLHWAVPDSADGDRDTPCTATAGADADAEVALRAELESAEDQLGAVLWNSNAAALHYLHRHILSTDRGRKENGELQLQQQQQQQRRPLSGLNVVELGAGVGCLGIALAMGGASVAITDLKELVPLMRHNIALNRTALKRQGGRCQALEWKWGPSVSVNPKKYAGKGSGGADKSSAVVEEAMLSALRTPSAPLQAVMNLLGSERSAVDYVVLCDALYGNPKDWLSLLYTLSEMLATNPDACVVVNFCEQRVDNVEGAFLELLREQNEKSMAAAPAEGGKEGGDGVKERVLQQVLREKRGGYEWSFHTETVADAHSDLDMTIRATVIRWVKQGGGAVTAAEGVKEKDEVEPTKKRTRHA